MKLQPTEKRRFIRVPFKTVVEVIALGRRIRSQDGLNISMSGIRLSANEAVLPEETPCQVTITLGTSGEPVLIQAQGKTVRSRTGSLAVEFFELDPDSYHHLRQLIMNNADDPTRAEREFNAHWGIRLPKR